MAVKISLNDKDQLVMENPIYPKLQKPVTNGIGLKNLQSRFELMMGTEVTAEDKGGVFRVVMQLKK
jgi:signal transduction histidine kinase